VSEETTTIPSVPPEIRRAQRWNIVWVVPIVALLTGAWLLFRHFTSAGPIAHVRFETAEQIAAAKTEVRCRSVKVGIVRSVALSEDLQSVMVDIEMDSKAKHLLRKDTRFWVVKVRFSGASVTGINTVLEGAHIELDPGPEDAEPESHFVGLETPPATNLSVPGRRILLTAEEAGLLAAGSPIYYRGFEVGRIEGRTLSSDGMKVSYNAFIQQDYAALVTENTRFWNTSGIDISAGADGFKIRTPALQALVSGGVSFSVPDGENPGKPVADQTIFTLHRDEDDANNANFNPTLKLMLLFDQTVRGLAPKAPVEFRGIPIGRVKSIDFNLGKSPGDPRMPVLVEIDPSLMCPESANGATPEAHLAFIKEAVQKGMRAALKPVSLINSALYVDLDYNKDPLPAELGKAGEYITLPTVPGSFAQLEAKLPAVVDKILALPIEKTMEQLSAAAEEAKITITEARTTMKEFEATAAAARKVLEDPDFRELPANLRKSVAELEKTLASVGPNSPIQGDLQRTLDEFRAALRAIKSVSTTVDDDPKSLIFGKDSTGNPTPKAPRGR
jgi:paraquat-inducible protein B